MRPAPALLLLTDTVVTSPDPDCCHSASYAQLLSVLEPISFLERTFRTFCHLFALLCIPAILKSNFMKQSYTRSINNDKQLIVSRVFERLLLSLTTDTWALGHITVAPRDPHLSWQGCGHWLRTPGGIQCQHLHRYQDQDSDWVSYWHIVRRIVWTTSAGVEQVRSEGSGSVRWRRASGKCRQAAARRRGGFGSRDWAHFRGARRY